jgi:hypothetical protein
MDKVLVVKAIEPNYNTLSGGPPVMMVGGGRRRGGDEPVGRTLRERAGGAAGGLVGVLGALGGQHRSLGGLVQSMISGGAQGKALGGALGRKFVGRTGQRRADIREGRRQQSAQSNAEMAEDVRNRGRGMGSRLNPYATYAGVRRRFNPDFQSGSERLENMGFNPFAAVRRSNTAVEEAEQQGLDRTNLNNRSRIQAQQQVGEYGAGRIADARNQAQRAANAEKTARSKAQGTQFGEEDRQYAEQYRNLRESLVAMGVPEQEVEQRMNAFNQQAKAQGYRVDPQPTSNDPTQGGNTGNTGNTGNVGNVGNTGNVGNVTVVDATGTHQGNAQQMTTPLALQQGVPDEGEGAENAKDNSAGTQFNQGWTKDALKPNKVAVTDSNEDEKEESLESIQRREAGQVQQPGMRPPRQNVEVRPTEQPSLYDFEQGGN